MLNAATKAVPKTKRTIYSSDNKFSPYPILQPRELEWNEGKKCETSRHLGQSATRSPGSAAGEQIKDTGRCTTVYYTVHTTVQCTLRYSAHYGTVYNDTGVKYTLILLTAHYSVHITVQYTSTPTSGTKEHCALYTVQCTPGNTKLQVHNNTAHCTPYSGQHGTKH